MARLLLIADEKAWNRGVLGVPLKGDIGQRGLMAVYMVGDVLDLGWSWRMTGVSKQ